jgi:hypothetical protein
MVSSICSEAFEGTDGTRLVVSAGFSKKLRDEQDDKNNTIVTMSINLFIYHNPHLFLFSKAKLTGLKVKIRPFYTLILQ